MTVIDRFAGPNTFLSNFHAVGFWFKPFDTWVPTAEHAYMALKTTDPTTRARILKAPTPREAKRIGRNAILRDGWDEGLRVASMQRVLKAKFRVGTGLAVRLLDTRDAVLIEGNVWHDNYWGICQCGLGDQCSREVGAGKNMLGELLMARRARLREVMQ
jgi:ribA/ribD-fused uncharacterized protein